MRLREEKINSEKAKLEELRQQCIYIINIDNPKEYQLSSDPYKTLFVYNLDYSTTEEKLKSVFSEFGEIKSIVKPKRGKGMGYAFIEFVNEDDFKKAFSVPKRLIFRKKK